MGTSSCAARHPTPLLERLQPLPEPERTGMRFVSLVATNALRAACALAAAHTVLPSLILHAPLGLVPPAIALVFSIAVHEAGHLSAGLSSGFGFFAIRSWPLFVSARGKHLAATLDLRFDRGHTTMVPGKAAHWWRFALLAFGGPLASLLAAAAALALIANIHELFCASTLSWIALLSCEFGLLNLIALRHDRVHSDGADAYDALTQNARWRREAALGRLLAARIGGADNAAYDDDALDDASLPIDRSRRTYGANAIAWNVRSPRNRQRALHHLETMLRCSRFATPAERAHLYAQCVIVTGWFAKNASLAKAWAAEIDPKFVTASDRLRVEAILGALDGEYLTAVRNVRQLLDDAVTKAEERDETYEQNMGLWIAQLRAMAERDEALAPAAVAAG